MYTEDDLLPISALQHLIFCERQCALIHIEQAWAENLFTAEGRVMHEHVHAENRESRGRIRIEHGMPLRSLRLGLIGKADVVEFHRQADGSWQPFPVEYKRGKPKKDNSDKVQLCAQALCLEEMLNTEVPEGALFYGKNRRRTDVVLDDTLRKLTEETAMRLHGLIASGHTPGAVYAKKCDSCSLAGMCLPKTAGKGKSVKRYLSGVVREL
ncbi:MAG: CRISPR-associated protein Cas4 [Desulfobacterales bacterium]|nr:CRISPR-associated protein Cas4 [Desulfobacterales bacterium]MDD4391493.1 CRISPR-associated protein Cas4 [Desulfobacterales bacterium]